MSRVGKKPVLIPAGVTAELNGSVVTVKGPKGDLAALLPHHVTASVQEGEGGKQLVVSVDNETDREIRALWGLWRSLIANMVQGVTTGFEKKLEIIGVGFKAEVKDVTLQLEVGYSHPVVYNLPSGIAAKVEKNVITISGADKQLVGEVAAQIRSIKKPEPYKGKGIKYADEAVRRKAGKAAKAGAAGK